MSDLSKIGKAGNSEGVSVENMVTGGPQDQTTSGVVPGFTFGSTTATDTPSVDSGFGASSVSADSTNPCGSNAFAFGASVPTTGAGRTGGPPAASANAGGFSFGGSNSFTFGAPMPEEIKVAGPRGQADMTASSSTATAGTSSAMSVSAAAVGGPRKKVKATIRGTTSSGTASSIEEGFSFETSRQAAPSAPVLSQKVATSAFIQAVEDGNLEAAKAVVGQVHVNVKDKDGATALFIAANKGYSTIVEWLLTLGADVNVCSVSTIMSSCDMNCLTTTNSCDYWCGPLSINRGFIIINRPLLFRQPRRMVTLR